MSEPRILTPTDRATIREDCENAIAFSPAGTRVIVRRAADLLALLDTCDAMANVIRRLRDGWRPVIRPHVNQYEWVHEVQPGPDGKLHQPVEPMSPAEAAVLDTTRQDHTDA